MHTLSYAEVSTKRKMERTSLFAEFCSGQLNCKWELYRSILINSENVWKYLNCIESYYHILFADILYLVETFMRYGKSAFLELDHMNWNNRDRILSHLVTKYAIAESSQRPLYCEIQISLIVNSHPLAVAYHLSCEDFQICGGLNGLPRALAFRGGRFLIPCSPEWESLMIQWKMWRCTLIEENIPKHSAYVISDYTFPGWFDPVAAMKFLGIRPPAPSEIMKTLEELVEEFSVEKCFTNIEQAAPCIESIFPQHYIHILDFYKRYNPRTLTYRSTFLWTRRARFAGSKELLEQLSRGRNVFEELIANLETPLISPIKTPTLTDEPSEDFYGRFSPKLLSGTSRGRWDNSDMRVAEGSNIFRREASEKRVPLDKYYAREDPSGTARSKNNQCSESRKGWNLSEKSNSGGNSQQTKPPQSSQMMVPTEFRRKYKNFKKCGRRYHGKTRWGMSSKIQRSTHTKETSRPSQLEDEGSRPSSKIGGDPVRCNNSDSSSS